MDEIKCIGRVSEKRGSVMINWGVLRCVEVWFCWWKWKKFVFGSFLWSESSKKYMVFIWLRKKIYEL